MPLRYFVAVRRWFSRTEGNTYHTVRVIDTETGGMWISPITYGYGDQWITTAADISGHDIRWGNIWPDVVEVTRRRDLHA